MEQIEQALRQAIANITGAPYQGSISLSYPNAQHGDIATNIALQLGAERAETPRAIADAVCADLQTTAPSWLKTASVAGPGFINITFQDSFLWQQAKSELSKFLEGQAIVCEYSCPNAFKELHTGHLYQTIIGDVLARLFDHAGAKVTRTNFGGDVGLHVAKCLWGVLKANNTEAVQSQPVGERAMYLSQMYVQGATAYEHDPAAKAEIEALNKQIYTFHEQSSASTSAATTYWMCREWSYEYFKDFYQIIEVTPFDRYIPESETAPIGLQLVREHPDIFTESQGALVFGGDIDGLHTRVFVTSEQLPTYETKDLGVISLEYEAYTFDKRYLITGNDQTEYMRVVFAAAERVLPAVAGKMKHITNGTIRFGDGQKMSSRLGNVNRAIDVLAAVHDQVTDQYSANNQIGLAAIKYSFLKQRIGGDIAFDVNESVSLHGNSGPYLQYAAVRAKTILQKAEQVASATQLELEASERLLLQKLSQFTTVIAAATRELAPQHICTYLYELAQEFNRFYDSNKVLGDTRQATRLQLVQRYYDTLQTGLSLLGITVPEKM